MVFLYNFKTTSVPCIGRLLFLAILIFDPPGKLLFGSLKYYLGLAFQRKIYGLRLLRSSGSFPTEDLSIIVLVKIVKVFRFQRKTLLFLLGFFFPIIIFLFKTLV